MAPATGWSSDSDQLQSGPGALGEIKTDVLFYIITWVSL